MRKFLKRCLQSFYFLVYPYYFLPLLIKVPINKPIPAAIAIDKIGFFLIGLSIFGLNVLLSSSNNSSNWLSIGSILSAISHLLSWIESMISNNWFLIPFAELPVWFAITPTKSSIPPFVASRVCWAMVGHFSCIKGIKLSIFSRNHFSEMISFSGIPESVSYTHLRAHET